MESERPTFDSLEALLQKEIFEVGHLCTTAEHVLLTPAIASNKQESEKRVSVQALVPLTSLTLLSRRSHVINEIKNIKK